MVPQQRVTATDTANGDTTTRTTDNNGDDKYDNAEETRQEHGDHCHRHLLQSICRRIPRLDRLIQNTPFKSKSPSPLSQQSEKKKTRPVRRLRSRAIDSADWGIAFDAARSDAFWTPAPVPGGLARLDVERGAGESPAESSAHGGRRAAEENGNGKGKGKEREVEFPPVFHDGNQRAMEHRIAAEHGVPIPPPGEGFDGQQIRDQGREDDVSTGDVRPPKQVVTIPAAEAEGRRSSQVEISMTLTVTNGGPSSPVSAPTIGPSSITLSEQSHGSGAGLQGMAAPWLQARPNFCDMYCRHIHPVRSGQGQNGGLNGNTIGSISTTYSARDTQEMTLTPGQEQVFFQEVREKILGSDADDEILRKLDRDYEHCRGEQAVEWNKLKEECVQRLEKEEEEEEGESSLPTVIVSRRLKKTPRARRRRDGKRFELE